MVFRRTVRLLTFFLSITGCWAQGLSFSRTDIPTGVGPQFVAVADFNNDGYGDLAVANSGVSSISILLGNGDGSFQSATTTRVGASPTSMAIADFNGDGNLDVVVNDLNNNTTTVLLGNGDGSFQPGMSLGLGTIALAAGDVNSDGFPDLVASLPIGFGYLYVFFGNGDGTFQPPIRLSLQSQPFQIVVADVNGDGLLDLVAVNRTGSNIVVVLGNGDGTFQAPAYYPVENSSSPTELALGDLNGDGIPDVLVGSSFQFNLWVLLGNGDGTFGPSQAYPMPRYVESVAIGDINNDGQPDILAATFRGSTDTSFATILLGQNGGTFGAPLDFAVDAGPRFIAVSDFNGDGRLDLVTADQASTGVTVLTNQSSSARQLSMSRH